MVTRLPIALLFASALAGAPGTARATDVSVNLKAAANVSARIKILPSGSPRSWLAPELEIKQAKEGYTTIVNKGNRKVIPLKESEGWKLERFAEVKQLKDGRYQVIYDNTGGMLVHLPKANLHAIAKPSALKRSLSRVGNWKRSVELTKDGVRGTDVSGERRFLPYGSDREVEDL